MFWYLSSLSVWLVRNYSFQSWNSVWALNEILSRSKWKASSLSDTAVFDQMTATTWNWLQYVIVATSHRKSSGRFIVICHVWEIHSSLPLAYLSFSSSSSSTSVGSCVFLHFLLSSVCARARLALARCFFFYFLLDRNQEEEREWETQRERENESGREEEETETETIFFSCLLLVYYNIDVRSSVFDDNEYGLRLKRLPQCQSYQVDLRASQRRKLNSVTEDSFLSDIIN